jgi:magnesium-transporting ATPase (P-type)
MISMLKKLKHNSQTLKYNISIICVSRASKTFIPCHWQDLSVGNIVRVRTDQAVPADILLLSSTSSENICYLDTAAIDGETNLKQKSITSCFLNIPKPEEISFELQCDPPNDDIYHFRGRIILSNETNVYPCDNNNLLLRGCVLRITDYVDGIIIYAGKIFHS